MKFKTELEMHPKYYYFKYYGCYIKLYDIEYPDTTGEEYSQYTTNDTIFTFHCISKPRKNIKHLECSDDYYDKIDSTGTEFIFDRRHLNKLTSIIPITDPIEIEKIELLYD